MTVDSGRASAISLLAVGLDVADAGRSTEAMRVFVIDSARDHRAARRMLEKHYDVLLINADTAPPDACCDLATYAARIPLSPALFVVGCVSPSTATTLLRAGAVAFFESPLSWDMLADQLPTFLDNVQICRQVARRLIGRVGLKDAQWYLRGIMVREAVARTGGSYRAAARLLHVDRRYVARVADEFRSGKFDV